MQRVVGTMPMAPRTAAPRARGLGQHFTGDLMIRGGLSRSDALGCAGEVDRLRLPTLLGRGRSFTPPDLRPRRLWLTRAQSFEGGLVVLEYAVWR
jgi:hypothetical protein